MNWMRCLLAEIKRGQRKQQAAQAVGEYFCMTALCIAKHATEALEYY